MDEIDLIILKKLMENSRVTYRELAELIGISVSSTHKRISNLIDNGVIEAFTARPSAIALKYLSIIIFGISKAQSLENVCKELGLHENIYSTAIATGKILYVSSFLKDITSLRDFGNYVSKTAQISDPTIGILNLPYQSLPEPLSSIDFKILKTLSKDARKGVTDIADEVGLSPKTVQKRLDRMIKNNLVEFSIRMTTKSDNNLITGFHISLYEGIHRQTPYLPQPKEKLYVDQNGYFRTSTTNRLLHRDIAYKYLYLPNRQNYPKGFGAYVVHHRDENKWHNDPSNLVLLESAQHTWLHNK
jgi:DNA-binding Lrp family transcriptional regulator